MIKDPSFEIEIGQSRRFRSEQKRNFSCVLAKVATMEYGISENSKKTNFAIGYYMPSPPLQDLSPDQSGPSSLFCRTRTNRWRR
jgi:hypothetical protein